MFEFVKQIFISAMMFFGCNLSNVNPLKSISMNNQTRNKECKIRPKLLMLIVMNLHFILTVLKQINAVVVAMIHKQKCVFLMLLKK